MFRYYVTFRISDKTIGGKTYNDRYQSLMAAAKKANGGFWPETTSFILAESNLETYAFAESLSKDLSKNHDLVVVIDPTDDSAGCFGVLEHEDILKSFFPKLKKVG